MKKKNYKDGHFVDQVEYTYQDGLETGCVITNADPNAILNFSIKYKYSFASQ